MCSASNVILVICLIIIDNPFMTAFGNQACKAYDDDDEEFDNFYSAIL